jgi:hypothetical protein
MRTTSQLRDTWAPACSPTVVRDLVPGIRISIDSRCVEAFSALGCVLQAWDYHVRREDTGAYNCRLITGGSGYSLHAYGIAIDINWNSNPYRADNRLVTDMPSGMVSDIRRIRTKGGHTVFRWGGDYQNVKDAMHYEVVASPTELATGIDWATVTQPARDQDDPQSWAPIQRGDRGPTVLELQDRLVELGLMTRAQVSTGPGVFGPATEAAVRKYQESHGLTVDGIVSLQTWTAILTDQPEIGEDEPGPIKGQNRVDFGWDLQDVRPVPDGLETSISPIVERPIERVKPLLDREAARALYEESMAPTPGEKLRRYLCRVLRWEETESLAQSLVPWWVPVGFVWAMIRRRPDCS